MPELTIKAPGKINLHLRVKGIRSDGYHDLESVFLALDFGDTLRFTLLDEPGATDLRISAGAAPLARENIVYRAISLFRARTGFNRGLRVDLEKRIPLGGGMGGGSSDAASTLLALKKLAGAELPAGLMEEMAGELGSDVPFFLTGGAAWVSGRGECVRPLPDLPNLWVVLVNPGFSSGTAEAFRLLDLSRKSREQRTENRGQRTENREQSEEIPLTLFTDHCSLLSDPRAWGFTNDFLPVFFNFGAEGVRGAYKRILSRLEGLGADFSGLSGAGSTCFGVFIDRGKAEKAVKSLSGEWSFTELTFPLARKANAVLK